MTSVLVDANVLLDIMTEDDRWFEWPADATAPYEAAFLAGKSFLANKRRDGAKRSPLPDLFIGTHAAIAGYECSPPMWRATVHTSLHCD